MRHTSLVRALAITLILSAMAPLLSACNTAAGAGQDVSAGGAAVTRGANDVRRAM